MSLFENREDAARQLSKALSAYMGMQPLVLAIPRGGVPLGRIIADDLGADLDVVLVRKLGAPFNPEFAVGAIGESGKIFVADYALKAGADTAYLAAEVDKQLATIRRRRAQYAAVAPPVSARGRTVIIVDDGLATGATMCSALAEIRSCQPDQLICAAPVASAEAAARVRRECDRFVCLSVAADFQGVGQFYRDFAQVSDEEAVALLGRS